MYCSFINPEINKFNTYGRLLDIGIGKGRLINILLTVKQIDYIGTETTQKCYLKHKKYQKMTALITFGFMLPEIVLGLGQQIDTLSNTQLEIT